MKEQFIRDFLDLIAKETMCGIQHNGCPCNTCFHTWVEDELNLSDDLSHLFWMVTLSLRGDYKEKEIIKSNKDFLLKVANKYKVKRKWKMKLLFVKNVVWW